MPFCEFCAWQAGRLAEGLPSNFISFLFPQEKAAKASGAVAALAAQDMPPILPVPQTVGSLALPQGSTQTQRLAAAAVAANHARMGPLLTQPSVAAPSDVVFAMSVLNEEAQRQTMAIRAPAEVAESNSERAHPDTPNGGAGELLTGSTAIAESMQGQGVAEEITEWMDMCICPLTLVRNERP